MYWEEDKDNYAYCDCKNTATSTHGNHQLHEKDGADKKLIQAGFWGVPTTRVSIHIAGGFVLHVTAAPNCLTHCMHESCWGLCALKV